MKIQLNLRALKAVALAMAKNDIRFFLNGVKIEHDETHTTLIATDGHRMHVARFEATNDADPGGLIITRDSVKLLLKSYKKMPDGMADMRDIEFIRRPVRAVFRDYSMQGSPYMEICTLEADYPDWRKAISESVEGEFKNIDGNYLADAQSAVKIVSNRLDKSAMYERKGRAIIRPDFKTEIEFIGIVMALGGDDPNQENAIPDWAKRVEE